MELPFLLLALLGPSDPEDLGPATSHAVHQVQATGLSRVDCCGSAIRCQMHAGVLTGWLDYDLFGISVADIRDLDPVPRGVSRLAGLVVVPDLSLVEAARRNARLRRFG